MDHPPLSELQRASAVFVKPPAFPWAPAHELQLKKDSRAPSSSSLQVSGLRGWKDTDGSSNLATPTLTAANVALRPGECQEEEGETTSAVATV